MNVDRARFLLLTTALSAATAVVASSSGCTVSSTATDAGTTTPGVDGSVPTDDGGVDAYVDSSDDASACLDDTGADPSCTAANASCTAACSRFLTNYKRGVARSITSCIIALPTCEGAEMEIAACVQTALGAACTDPTAEGFCDPLVMLCDTDSGAANALDKVECADLASGLNAAGRTAFTSCINEGQGTGYCKPTPSTCFDTVE